MLRPKQSLGQNFLNDPNTARKIADALEAPVGAPVVEIGPGTGAMTEPLLARYPDLTALEVDDRAVAVLRERYPSLDVRHADVLEVDWPALADERGAPLHVIGNLPYYITSPILFGLLDAGTAIREVVVMMQLEVAERLVAVPRTKAYGILSVAVQLVAEPTLLFRVSRNVFYPKPDVTSAVVRLSMRQDEGTLDVDRKWVRHVVRTAFNQRRKTLRNSLKPITGGADLPGDVAGKRAEELTPTEFVDLARTLLVHRTEQQHPERA